MTLVRIFRVCGGYRTRERGGAEAKEGDLSICHIYAPLWGKGIIMYIGMYIGGYLGGYRLLFGLLFA